MPGIYWTPYIHANGAYTCPGREVRFLIARCNQYVWRKFTAISEALDQTFYYLIDSADFSQGPWQDKQPARFLSGRISYRPINFGEHSKFFPHRYCGDRDDYSMAEEQHSNCRRRAARKMGRARLLMTGVFLNWTAFAVAAVVSFFLSPFVVHRLGNAAYGVWILANSSIAYMALLDLGMRGAVTHFVAKHYALGDHVESSKAVSVALGFRLVIALVVTVASVTLAALASKIFRMPVDLWHAARWAIVIVGVNLSLTLIVGVFAGVLTGLQRFGLISALAVAQTLLGAAGTVWLLKSGYGIVPLAAMQLAVAILLGTLTIELCFRSYPELRIGVQFLSKGVVKNLWRFSSYLFVIAVTGQVIYYTDNLVVGVFQSTEALAFYAIGGRFIEYFGQLGSSLAQTVLPVASNLAAREESDKLRRLLIHGTRAAVLVSLPIAWALFFRSQTFIGLWMGSQYAQPSGQVLRVLLLSSMALSGNRVGGNIVLGLGKHRPFAVWQSCEAVANLGLSIYLVRRIGILGVAWGTVLPSLVSQILLWPRYISRLLGLSVSRYFWDGWIRPLLATAPFGLACLWIDHHWAAQNMAVFFLQIASALPIALAGVTLFFWKEVSLQLRTRNSLLRSTFWG
jgi:O-antigen/teichoic acid export membrane protein